MQRFKPVFKLFSAQLACIVAGNDIDGVKSVKDDFCSVDAILLLRIFLYGGVGGVAIQVGVRGRDVVGPVVVVVPGTIVLSMGATKKVDSLWIREDKLAVGVQIGEAAIEGKGKNAHIPTLFGDWSSFKSDLSTMGIAPLSAI